MATDNILSMYLQEINKIPLLTREEENELALKAKAGDKAARDKIANANLRFVVNIAKKYRHSGMDLTDLISEGNVGLLTAIDKFDVEKGYHFISYAVWWIRQSILKAIYEKKDAIRLPLNRVNELVKIKSAKKAVSSSRKSEEQEIREVAESLNMDKDVVRDLLNISREMVSLDASVQGNSSDDSVFGDFIEDTRYESPEESSLKSAMKREVNGVLESLKPKEAKVLKMRFGLNGAEPMSLKEVGDACSLTKERIRQIEKNAIERARIPAKLKKLEAYVAA
ncbi:MAG: RNA polymerase sigma factor RpoD/SigA [Treponema sp.]|nr:RNA polymerase sigma factor RpoD/SigA [Treponema sp.]